MEITGTIISVLPLQTGQGAKGAWQKREFILETPGQFPKKVSISVWGDKVDEYEHVLQIGQKLTASINIESREYNGRWYTEVRAWKFDTTGKQHSDNVPTTSHVTSGGNSGGSDDLPF